MVREIATLVRNAREHSHRHALHCKQAARGGTHGVMKYRAALGQECLPAVAIRHLPAENVFEIGFDFFHDVLVKLQLQAKGGADGLLGQVVIGGTQAADEDQQIATAPRNIRHLSQAPGIVAHCCMVEHIHPGRCDLF